MPVVTHIHTCAYRVAGALSQKWKLCDACCFNALPIAMELERLRHRRGSFVMLVVSSARGAGSELRQIVTEGEAL